MKAHAALSLALVTTLASIPAGGSQPPPVAATAPNAARPPLDTAGWRVERERQLVEPDGWLAVAGLFFLHPGINTIGSGPASDIALPPGSAPVAAGRILLNDGAATLDLNPGVAATINKEPVAGRVVLRLANADEKRPADRVQVGRLSLHLHLSGERLAVRLRDPESPWRRSFAGLRWFDIADAWKITGRFLPYASPRVIAYQNILGDVENAISPGEAEFVVGGQHVRLVALKSGERLWFVFRDATAGTDTYRIRFLYADAPSADGRVTLDFNRAYNPPCAYNPHTTCPVPLPQNRLTVAIPAGEKLYVHRQSSNRTAAGAERLAARKGQPR